MGYAHQKEYHRTNAASFASTGIKATFTAGLIDYKLRKVAVVITTQMTVTPPVLTIRHRPTAGSATGQTTVDTITVPTASVAGKIIYVAGLDTLVSPGQQIVFDVTTAATAGDADIVAEFDPCWEILSNVANAALSV